MRILLFSDLHLDRPYEWAPQALARRRREEAKDCLVHVLSEARRHSVDVVACAGGLFHRDCVQPANLRWLMTALGSVGVPVFISPGDEDWLGPRSGYTQFTWPDNVTIFDSQRLTPIQLAEDVTIWGGAHRDADGAGSFLDRFHVEGSGIHIGLFHASERTGLEREPGVSRCAPFDEDDLVRTGLDHVLVGHFSGAHFGARHTYSGSPIAHDCGGAPSGGAVIIEFASEGLSDREFVPVPSTELNEVRVDVTGVKSEADLLRLFKGATLHFGGVVRLRVEGFVPYQLTLQRHHLARVVPNAAQVLLDTKGLSTAIDVDELQAERSVRGQFVRDVVSSERVSDSQRNRILSMGLRALEGNQELRAIP